MKNKHKPNKKLIRRYSHLIRTASNSVKYRLKVLKLAEELGNVSEACRQSGMDRTSFYVYKRRFEKYGVRGLENFPPIHHSHPNITSSHIAKKILELSSDNPGWGCNKLSEELKLDGISRSHQTVQEILVKEGLGTKQERMDKSSNSVYMKV